MDLSPGERSVWNLIRALFLEDFQRTRPLALLRGRWPVAHDEAYAGGYEGLLRKGLIEKTADGRSFTITKQGLNAIAAKTA